ncbi:MAG: hypothetical protein IKG78_11675 [Fibrobacter sp.]|nr:hypothetical protein [Fibrobacter sp.]
MDVNFFLEYFFWLPVLLWVGLHFWFRNVSYVVFMKKQVNRGEKWAYVSEGFVKHPERVKLLRFCDILFTLVVSAASSLVVVWLLKKQGLETYSNLGFLSVIIFAIVAYLMVRRTELKLTDLFQSAFYLEYRWVRYGIDCKGIMMSEENVQDRAGLSYAHKLRNAEDHHRFWRYVKAMAKSKKVPPEMFEVY